MSEPVWLKRAWVDAVHFQQLKRFGGLFGIRDDGAIESALSRARNRWEYAEEQDLAVLAAAYGFGLARSHGYSDGNKRIAFLAVVLFLEVNGVILEADEPEVVRVMIGVAAGDVSEDQLADWIRRCTS